MAKIALITGATSGIGKTTAELFADNGVDLVICGRREERLNSLKNKLSKVKVHTLSFNVRDRLEVESSINSLPAPFDRIDMLINNAGNAHGLSAIDQGNVEDWDNMIDLNVKGLLYVSRAIMPGMVARKQGHIVNIGSIAAQEVYPKGNVYCATKHAVEAISKGMRIDLLEHNIRVSSVHPGAVNTEFSLVRYKGDREKADAVYKGFEPLVAKDVARSIWFIVSSPAHVNIAELTILPSAQANATHVRKQTD